MDTQDKKPEEMKQKSADAQVEPKQADAKTELVASAKAEHTDTK